MLFLWESWDATTWGNFNAILAQSQSGHLQTVTNAPIIVVRESNGGWQESKVMIEKGS